MFSTYGVPMISGEVKRFLRDNNAVRVSRSMRDTAYRAMQIKEQLTNENGKEPNITEIAKRMELPPEDIVIALESIVEPVSLYEPVFSDGGDTIYIMDQVKGGTTDGDWLEEIAMREAIRDLTDRERKILSMRFIDGKTQTEVAGEIGISQAQVSRLEKGAMSKSSGAVSFPPAVCGAAQKNLHPPIDKPALLCYSGCQKDKDVPG